MLSFIEMKHSRPPNLKSSSNVSLTFAWITGPATDPSFNLFSLMFLKFPSFFDMYLLKIEVKATGKFLQIFDAFLKNLSFKAGYKNDF